MTIQKSRLAAIVSMMLVVCVMVTTMVVPASAASVPLKIYECYYSQQNYGASIYEYLNADLQGCGNYAELAYYFYSNSNKPYYFSAKENMLFVPLADFEAAIEFYNAKFDEKLEVPELPLFYYEDDSGTQYIKIVPYAKKPNSKIRVLEFTEKTSSVIGNVVSSDGLSGVLAQIVEILPVVLVVIVGFIALRKGISFVQGVLNNG